MSVQQWTYFTIQNSVPLAPVISAINFVPSASNATFALTFTSNASGRPPAGYILSFYRSDGAQIGGPISNAVSRTYYTLTTQPVYGSNYYATVTPSNFAGIIGAIRSSSPSYLILYGSAPIYAPAAVTMTTWTTATPRSILMTWTAPASSISYAPLNYYYLAIGTGNTIASFSRVQYTTTSNTTIYTFSTSTNVYNPVIGTTYYAVVASANTLFGIGASTITAAGTRYGTVPTSPSPVSLSWNAGTANKMSFTWTNSVDHTYDTVTTYYLQIFYNTSNVAVNTSLNNANIFWGPPYSSLDYSLTNTSYASGANFGALTLGYYYSAAVWASNAIGSNIAVSGTTRFGSAPASFTATCTWDSGTDSNLKVSWTNPVDSTYNTPYGLYSVGIFRSNDNATIYTQSAYSYSNTSFSGGYGFATLTLGSNYYATINSSNIIGVTSAQSGYTRFGSAPPGVTGLNLSINYGGNYLTASWTVPSTSVQNTIGSISVQFYYSNGSVFGSAISLGASDTTTNSGNFSSGSTYYCIVTTSNVINSTNVQSTNVFTVGTPSVTATTAVVFFVTQLTISWPAVSGATSYILYTNGNGGVNIGNVTSKTTNVSNTYYIYRVAATDSVTTGLASDEHGLAYYYTAGQYNVTFTVPNGAQVIMRGGGAGKGNAPSSVPNGSGGYLNGYIGYFLNLGAIFVGGGGQVGVGGYNGGGNGGDVNYGSGGGGYSSITNGSLRNGQYVTVGGGGGCGCIGNSSTNHGSPYGYGGNGGGSYAQDGGGTNNGRITQGLDNGGTLPGGDGATPTYNGSGGAGSWGSGSQGSYGVGGAGGNTGRGKGGGGGGGLRAGGGGCGQDQNWTTYNGWGQAQGQSQQGGSGGGGGTDYTANLNSGFTQTQGGGGAGASTSYSYGGDGSVFIFW
jgi:hypothetical protein